MNDSLHDRQPAADTKRVTIRNAAQALVQFKREFKRDLTASLLTELHVAMELDLLPVSVSNQQGFDLIGADGKRYQIKHRGCDVLDVNNFDLDYLVLVNLTDDYRVEGMWMLLVESTRTLFVHREKFRKYQAVQKCMKKNGDTLSLARCTLR